MYAFGGPLSLAGNGRGSVIPDGDGQGKLGALRYEPGATGSVARVITPVMFSAGSEIHVSHSSNRLELDHPLTGAFPWVKTGGGQLWLNAGGETGPMVVSNGTLGVAAPLSAAVDVMSTATLTGHGSVGAVSGQGTVRVHDARLDAESLSSTHVIFTAQDVTGPSWGAYTNTQNSVMVLPGLPVAPLSLTFYVSVTGALENVDIPVGFVVPHSDVVGPVLPGTPVAVYQNDPGGAHHFEASTWTPVDGVQLVAVPVDVPNAPAAHRITALRINGAPAGYAAWRADAFPDPDDHADDAFSGPLADPEGVGVSNLLRYALSIPWGADPELHTIQPERSGDTVRLHFPFDPAKTDVRWVVEGTTNPADWDSPTIIYDSHLAPPEGHEAAWAWISCPEGLSAALFRLRLTLHP